MTDLSQGNGTDDGLDSVTQSRVPAAGAPPVATVAPNSIFALGQAAAASAHEGDQAGEQAPDLADLEAQTLELLTKGDLSTRRIADALGVGLPTAKKVTERLQKGRKLWRIGKGPATRFSLAKGGFQGWLAKQGAPASAAKAKRRAPQEKPHAKAPARVVAPIAPPPPPPAPMHPAEGEDIELGLIFNGEEVSIGMAFSGQPPIRLNPQRSKKLLAWLNRMSLVLPEVEGA